MTNDTTVACSLSAGELKQRLAAIAETGARSLISRDSEGDRHLLRFEASGRTRRQLEDIVAAESRCCPFLDLSLSEQRDELVLSIAGPEDARTVVDELAAAFGGVRAERGGVPGRVGALIGAGGLALTVCWVGAALAEIGPTSSGSACATTRGFFCPDLYDLAGATICLAGIGVMMYPSR